MKIVIVGGGTAGWIAAATLIKETVGHDITVIESSKYGIIGAGEGSTGSFPWFINQEWPDNLVDEIDMLKKTKGTIKLGIKLKNWRGDGRYIYSPINASMTSHNHIDIAFFGSILKNGRGDMASLQYHLLENRITPFSKKTKRGETGELTLGHNTYSYHFDGYEVGKYFKDICLKFGVKVIDSEVTDVIFDEKEYVKNINLSNGENISADMWFDCSGFNRILIGKTKNKWISYKDNLPVNTAIPFSTEITPKNIRLETLAETMNAGWMWKIPLQERYGNGYVYCDGFQTKNKAVDEIERKIGQEINSIREIKFEAGRYENTWYNNVISFGLASHFLEPLQATSIHISLIGITNFINHYLKSNESIKCEISKRKYNQSVNKMIDDTRDLLQMHYLSGRDDTPFWKFIKNEMVITDSNKELIEISKHRLLNMLDFKDGHGMSGWGIWCHILEMAGLFKDKKMIERELITADKLDRAYYFSKLMEKEYGRIHKEYMTNEEFFKYIKQ